MQEQKNYKQLTREEQLETLGYVVAEDLSIDEIKKLKQAKGYLEKITYRNGTTIYNLKVYFTNSLLVVRRLSESEFLVLTNRYSLGDTIIIPFRLFNGVNKNGRPYNQYEILLVVSDGKVWVIRDFFNNKEHGIVLDSSKDLKNYMITRKDNVEDDEPEQEEKK